MSKGLLKSYLAGETTLEKLKEYKEPGFIYQCITTVNGTPVYEDLFGTVFLSRIGYYDRINKKQFLKATASSKTVLLFVAKRDFARTEDLRRWAAFGALEPLCGFNWIIGVNPMPIEPTEPAKPRPSIFDQEDWNHLYQHALTRNNDEL